MPQALAEDRIDAFSAWEPTPVLAFAAHPEFRLVHKSLSYGFLCFRRDFVAAHPAEAREIAAAVLRSCLWMRIPENIDRAAGWTQLAASRFQGREYPLTADQMAALTRRDLLNIPGSPQIPEVLLGEHGLLWKKFNFLKETGKIPQTTPWEKVRNSFDTEMLRAILSEPKRNDLEKFDYRGEKQQGATP